jgi:hypothetical protein
LHTSDTTYQSYYLRAIDHQQTNDQIRGLKLVVGPTGLGKTYAIPHVIAELQERGSTLGCIYTTHRHMLLEEMQQKLVRADIAAVYLRSNTDQVYQFLEEVDLPGLLDDLEQADVLCSAGATRERVLQLAANIQQWTSMMHQNATTPELRQVVRTEQQSKSAAFIKIFEAGIKNLPIQARERWVYDSRIWKLFPYLAFLNQRPRPVLLVTVSKLLHGFFNGQRTQTMTSLRDNIIFLDEFEFQEREILSFLCQQTGIRDNFEFVRLFYNEMVGLRHRGQLALATETSSARQEARQHIHTILQQIEEPSMQVYQFPRINRFILNPTEFHNTKNITVFQSNHIVQTTPFYIVPEEQAWRIVRQRNAHTLPSFRLLRFVSRTTDAILNFFANLWSQDLEPEWREWIDLCYNRRNDSLQGAYQRIIAEYGQLKRPVILSRRGLPHVVDDSIYAKGFTLYRLTTGLYQATVPDEARAIQQSLHVTPEYILWQLCQSNLVFGISATGDIPRYVQAFDLPWLERACDFLPVDAEDKALIAHLTERKKAHRTYNVSLELATLLSDDHRLQRMLDGLVTENFFDSDQPVTSAARRTIVNRFLETLRWVTTSSQNCAHLVFVNSFRFISKLLERKCQMHERDEDDMPRVLHVQRGRAERSQEYRVRLDGALCTVIFLDAAKAREQDVTPFAYHPEDGTLILVTQYETAANGVNLEWRNVTDTSAFPGDFQSIHLLESKHFYFDDQTALDEAHRDAASKSFFWRLWKLAEGRQISQHTLKTHLERANSGEFNATDYKQTTDYLLNQIALFHQAFGRIDRKHTGTHTAEVRLADTSSTGRTEDSVFAILDRYLAEGGAIGQQRDDRAIYTSPLILQVYEAVYERSMLQRATNQFYREDLSAKQQRSRECIQQLLELIKRMRAGEFNAEQERMIKRTWIAVREAVLRQDYHFRDEVLDVTIDFQRDCVHSTAYVQKDDYIYVDHPTNPSVILRDAAANTVTLSLNWPYRQIAQHPRIRQYFQVRAYPTSYQRTITHALFTPYILQAVLAGAVGEEALQAVLEQYQVPVEDTIDHPAALFEDFDLKIAGQPVYLDAKSFSQMTIDRINATSDDPAFQPHINSAELLYKAQAKWQRIVNVTGDPSVKFVIVNLQVADERANEYWDAQLNPVERFQDSAITLIQGILDQNTPTGVSSAFQQWIHDIREG